MKSAGAAALVVALALAGSSAVAANVAGALELVDREPLLDCLTPERGDGQPIPYPGEEAAKGLDGTVRVRLKFTAPDRPPEITVLHATTPGFEAAMRQRVESYRLPCLPVGGRPVTASQEFQFSLRRERVVDTQARPESPWRKTLACLQGASLPEYPRAAERAGEHGVVLVELAFEAPTEAPKVKVLFDGGNRHLRQFVEDYVATYRLPCLSEPLAAMQAFRFLFQGDSYELRKAKLTELLGGIANLQEQRVRFDFRTMGCPFDVTVDLYQPYASNTVRQSGPRDANRREFLEWLATLPITVPKSMQRHFVGAPLAVEVPCVVLDLL